MPHMYILECNNGQYYTGSTRNLERGLDQHFQGKGANFTRKHKPVRLVYAEAYDRVQDAYYREKQIQGWSHAKKKALITQKFIDLHSLAACQNQTHFTLSTSEFPSQNPNIHPKQNSDPNPASNPSPSQS